MTFTESEHPRGLDGVFTDKAQSAPEASLSPIALPMHFQTISDEAGLGGVMPAVLEVLLDRETIDDATLVALTSEDVTELYERFIGPGIDDGTGYMHDLGDDRPSRLHGSDYQGKELDGDEPSRQQVETHIHAISDRAGLSGVMPEILQVYVDREDEDITGREILRMDSDDVAAIYEDFIAPAIDRAEQHLTEK